MKHKKNYIIIIIYGLLLIFLLLGVNNFYGSSVDWAMQHTVFPDYFRNLFYETKRLIPNLSMNIGAAQNIFNFSYYGLMSPIILISYFLPFIDMTTYISIISIILHIGSGVLLYKFLINHNDSKVSLLLSLIFLTFAPLTYHFHHHIMFVWYFPFLILSFMGIDKYIKEKKSALLIISIFLIILTNYYYAVTSILVIIIYGIYSLLDNYQNIKQFITDILKASIRIIIPILLASFILLPTLYTLLKVVREDTIRITLANLLTFNIKQSMYYAFSAGISFLFITSIISIVTTKEKKEIFLNSILFLITFVPIFMYILNGFLYIRGKVLIPFIMLYIISLTDFIKKLKNDKINIKKLLIALCMVIIYIIVTNKNSNLLPLFMIDALITIISIIVYNKSKKITILLIPLFIITIGSSVINNMNAKYLDLPSYYTIKNNDKEIKKLISLTHDNSFYRTDTNIKESINMNKIYTNNHYSTSIYSSAYNSLYNNFYSNNIGNNLKHRNYLMSSGAYNPLFNEFMGIKYIVTKEQNLPDYEKIGSTDHYNLYKNDDVLPVIYSTENYGSVSQYEKLKFPYNIEYMLKYPVTSSDISKNYISKIEELNLDIEKKYKFVLDDKKKITYTLNEPISNKYLILKFDIDYNQGCSLGDISITINGVKNKLTCKQWIYHNKNYTFEYIISSNEALKELEVELTKGKYEISNVKLYTLPKIEYTYKNVNNLKIDKKNSTITGEVNLDRQSYIITSLPYDEGYKVYVDEKEIKKEIVNTSFLGFKIIKGSHNIKIVYKSPLYMIGLFLSGIGLMGFLSVILLENKKVQKLLNKYKEIILYLIFGALTTIVSLVTYYLLTKTILSANNSIELQIANIISWVVSVTFAYITNKKYVFKSNGNKFKEFISFYTSRLLTLFIDMLTMFIFVSLLKFNDSIIKIISQILIIVLNYILSKFIVFKGEK